MMNSTEGSITGPLRIVLLVVIGIYAIISFINPVIILQLLTIIIIIILLSLGLITIVFNLLPILLSFSKRFTNILPSIVIVMLTSATIINNTPRAIFHTELVYLLLTSTLIIIGIVSIGFAFTNKSFPKWYRQSNFLIGSFSLILSLFTILFPAIGFDFLTIVICALFALDKSALLFIGSGEEWKWSSLFKA